MTRHCHGRFRVGGPAIQVGFRSFLWDRIRRERMKTFFEYCLEEVACKHEAGELEVEKAHRWVAEMQLVLSK